MKLFNTAFYSIFNEGLGRIFLFFIFLSFLETVLELLSLGLFLVFIKSFTLPNDTEIFQNFSNLFANYTLDYLLLIFVIFFIFKIFTSYLITLYINYKSQNIYKDLRVNQFKNFINSNIKNYISLNLGQIMNLIHTDTKIFVDTYFLQLIEFFRSLLIVLGLCTFVLILQPNFMFAVVPFFILGLILQSRFIRKILHKLSEKFRENYIVSQQEVYSLVNSIKEIKIFQKENHFVQKLKKIANNLKLVSIKQFFFISYTKPLLEICFILSCSLIFFIFSQKNYGSNEIIFYLSGFAFCFLRIMPFFNSMSNNFSKINLNYESLKRFVESRAKYKILKNKNFKSSNIKDYKDFKFQKYEIKILEFNLNKNVIFKNTNFSFNNNDKILIYGRSGCGKSTLLEIISGFHNLNNNNKLLINSNDNKNTYNNLKKKICYLPQTVSILDGTIVENISFGGNQINLEKAKNCLIRSGLEEFVNKYEIDSFRLSSGINNISEGQKKRLSLARAFYYDKEILLLDELTSNLDKFNEERILNDLLKDKDITLIVVSHDTNLKKMFNNIYKIEDKKIEKE